MKFPALVWVLISLAAALAHAQDAALGMNPLLDPFAANSKPVLLPPPPPPKGFGVGLPALPPPPPPTPAAVFPTGLRALLIRDKGVGLIGGTDAEAASIAVADGRPVRIGDQDYTAEVSASEIRLFARGKLVWQGTLGGPAQPLAPVDMSQVKFVPPLSAGVNPGLRSAGASGGAPDSIIRKTGAP